MIALLINVLILLIIFGVIWYIVTLIPLPEPFLKVAQIVLLVIFLLVLLGIFVGGVPLLKLPLS